jgi:hypothetical protein
MCTEGMMHDDSQLRAGKLLRILRPRDHSAGSVAPVCPAQWEMRQIVPPSAGYFTGVAPRKINDIQFVVLDCSPSFMIHFGEFRDRSTRG